VEKLGRGLVAAVVTAGALLVGVPASAAGPTPVAASNVSERVPGTLRPPVIQNVRHTCHAEGAIVAIRLRNPNRVELSFQIQLSAGPDVQEAQVVTLAGRTSDWAEFHEMPDGEYLIDVVDDQGDVVATRTGTVVECPAPAPAPATALPASPVTAGSAPDCDVDWGSQPKALPWTGDVVLTGLRAGRHACFDRLVMDGGWTGSARYVDEVRWEGSGRVVPVRGGARLEIVTTSSTGADTPWGSGYVPPANSRELVDVAGWPTFRQLAYAGDTDMQRTTLALGVRARLPFRLFRIGGPDQQPRMVLDVAHRW
jgi:hypothetical protein